MMPIKVKCQCGKVIAAPDSFAGKTAKCPACQQPIAIPAASADAPAAPAAAPLKVTCQCGKTLSVPAAFAGKTAKCPACQQPLKIPAAGAAPAAATSAPAPAPAPEPEEQEEKKAAGAHPSKKFGKKVGKKIGKKIGFRPGKPPLGKKTDVAEDESEDEREDDADENKNEDAAPAATEIGDLGADSDSDSDAEPEERDDSGEGDDAAADADNDTDNDDDDGKQSDDTAVAGLGKRFVALLIDSVVATALFCAALAGYITFVAGDEFKALMDNPTQEAVLAVGGQLAVVGALASALPLVVFILMEGVFAGTVGKLLLGLRVADGANYPCGLVKAVLRNIIKSFLGLLSMIFALFMSRRRALHDLVAGTIVINRDALVVDAKPAKQKKTGRGTKNDQPDSEDDSEKADEEADEEADADGEQADGSGDDDSETPLPPAKLAEPAKVTKKVGLKIGGGPVKKPGLPGKPGMKPGVKPPLPGAKVGKKVGKKIGVKK